MPKLDSNIYGSDSDDFAMGIASDALTPKASNEGDEDARDVDNSGSRGNHFNVSDAPGGKYREVGGDEEKINAGEVTYAKKVVSAEKDGGDSRAKSKGN